MAKFTEHSAVCDESGDAIVVFLICIGIAFSIIYFIMTFIYDTKEARVESSRRRNQHTTQLTVPPDHEPGSYKVEF